MNEKELEQLKAKAIPILKKYGAAKVALFGSRATGNAKFDSDYDLLIEFLPGSKVGLFKFQSIEKQLTETLGATVDIATPKALNRHIKNDVLKTAKAIYGK